MLLSTQLPAVPKEFVVSIEINKKRIWAVMWGNLVLQTVILILQALCVVRPLSWTFTIAFWVLAVVLIVWTHVVLKRMK